MRQDMRASPRSHRRERLPPLRSSWQHQPIADALLSGMIKSSDGKAMGGVTVSAKPEGGTITTTVFTDEAGNYYFPPLPAGHYRVWAQALSYQTAKGEVDLAANAQAGFHARPDERSRSDLQAASGQSRARGAAARRRTKTRA